MTKLGYVCDQSRRVLDNTVVSAGKEARLCRKLTHHTAKTVIINVNRGINAWEINKGESISAHFIVSLNLLSRKIDLQTDLHTFVTFSPLWHHAHSILNLLLFHRSRPWHHQYRCCCCCCLGKLLTNQHFWKFLLVQAESSCHYAQENISSINSWFLFNIILYIRNMNLRNSK